MASNPPEKQNRHIVARADDLQPGARTLVRIDGREIGIFNIGGALYALRNVCPHKGGPLCRGRLRPLVVSDGVHHIAHERENEILKCPWHQWEFDIKTGRALFDPALRVRTYIVAQEDQHIILYTD